MVSAMNRTPLLLMASVATLTCCATPPPDVEWAAVGGDREWTRHSKLSQINRDNVKDLEVAWTYHTGELDPQGRGRTIECTPLMVDGVLYITTARRRVIALDAATGTEIWTFDPGKWKHGAASGGVNRGLAYWTDGEEARILHGSSDGRLFSLDARTGSLDPAFGDNGTKDLREDLEPYVRKLSYGPTSAPAICGDVVVIGCSCGEGPGIAAPGDVRGFDVRSGREVWRFHTVPRPGEYGHHTWEGDSWRRRGAANAWGGVSVDTQRQWVFVGLGSASFDFYGGDRKGQNLFANSTVALDGKTGERLWHFQTLHHDLWDHDLPVCPNLVTLERDGTRRDVVVQPTKTGHVYVFDRETGTPVFPVEERPVPASDVPGEEAWPTQPVPTKPPPFVRTEFTEKDITNISAEAHAAVKKRFETLRSGPGWNPPSLQGTVCVPGFHGGATWSGACFDPESGWLYVNGNNVPNIITLVPAKEGSGYPYRIRAYEKFLDPEGYPAIKPPWGTLTAIDLHAGEIVWQVPLGEHEALRRRGIPPTGTETFGGAIVTAGGLVFIGGSKDEKMHAYDAETGALLWERPLPAGGYATPCTYRVAGRQFVVIAAGGAGKPGTKAGDAFVAFALPVSDQ